MFSFFELIIIGGCSTLKKTTELGEPYTISWKQVEPQQGTWDFKGGWSRESTGYTGSKDGPSATAGHHSLSTNGTINCKQAASHPMKRPKRPKDLPLSQFVVANLSLNNSLISLGLIISVPGKDKHGPGDPPPGSPRLVCDDAALGDDDQQAAQEKNATREETKRKCRDAHHVPQAGAVET